MSITHRAFSDPLTKADVQKWTNRELALAVTAAAIGSGDIEVARVLREAAERLKAVPEGIAESNQ